jgi:galacturan 1,4-alpha-galacturonidase
MKFLTVALLIGVVSGLAEHLIPGARIIPAKDISALRSIGAHRQKYPDRRTITIRPSKNDDDDVSWDFLWGIKQANHGGRLLLQKGKTYVIGKKLDLSFLNDIEVQLEGEIKVRGTISQQEVG